MNTQVKVVAVYMIFIAIALRTAYLAQWIVFVATRQVLVIITLTEHPASVVFALDLSLVVPVFFTGCAVDLAAEALGLCIGGHCQCEGRGLHAGLMRGNRIGGSVGRVG